MVSAQIFLLGGMDLEMITIESVLREGNYNFYNRNLNWTNASVMAYSDIIWNNELSDSIIYGIELIEDNNCLLPHNYVPVDHHNNRPHSFSALEQVASLIQIELTREQLLIAANDKGYIPAMLKMGASEEEVARIRLADRRAQGATEHDEYLAEISIKENISCSENVTLVKSLTNKFSTITDRLYPVENLIIYTNDEVSYYGIKSMMVADSASWLIQQKKAYSGGGDNGYFGITSAGIHELGSVSSAIEMILYTIKQ